MTPILWILAFLSALHIAVPCTYYAFMKRIAEKRSWNLSLDRNYEPRVTVIVPTYNEAHVIVRKLQNLEKLDYPKDKLEIIIVDSASTDGTANIAKHSIKKNQLEFRILILEETQRSGKSKALNYALQHASGDLIATSDADSFWEPDALRKAVPFFSDPSIGAVTGREELINLEKTIHTLSEGLYRKFYYILRLGESKIHSTLIFQGELSLYRKSALKKFEDKAGCSDDTGTIVDFISRGYRCIFLPEAVFHDTAAHSLHGRLSLKSRRAQHLISGITKSLKLKLQNKLPLPSSIVLFSFYMHVISPLLLLFTAFTVIVAGFLYFQIFYFLISIVVLLLISKKSRLFTISYLTSNLALIMGLTQHFMGKKEATWQKIEEMRAT